MENYTIRLEEEKDFLQAENLVREAFWNVYKPGCAEHYLLHCLRNSEVFVKDLSFVMEQDGTLIGQNIFCKAQITCDNGKNIPILTMGPISILPSLKRQGYGKILLDYTLQKAAEKGFCAVCIEGNYDFYSKSGFDYARNFGLRYAGLPEGMDDSFFLCKELIPGFLNGIKGEYSSPEAYMVDDASVDEYDKNFTPKQKLKLPGQLF